MILANLIGFGSGDDNIKIIVDKFFELFIGDEAVFSLIDHRKNR